jgi:membrane dipeptidase
MGRTCSLLLALLVMSSRAIAADAVVSHEARALHERLLVLDTHLDTPHHFGRPGWSILDRHSYDTDLSQVDHPRMRDGGLDGGFWVIYTPQRSLTPQAYSRARDYAIRRAVRIREMIASHPDRFALALDAADAANISSAGKRSVYLSIENSYPLGTDLSLLDTFHDLGVRLIGPVHYAANQFADSSTDAAKWRGLSPLGRQLVQRANRLGMVLDASHASDASFDQMIELSKTPIVLSHSGVKHSLDHPRNIDDQRLRELAASGGVIQVIVASDFLVHTPAVAEISALQEELEAKLEGYTAAQIADLAARMRKAAVHHRVPRATFDDFMRSLLHAIAVAGVDHVGIGADWDGGGGVDGLQDVTDLPKVTAALLRAGYAEADIAKIMGGNILRVLEAAEAYALGAGNSEN